MTLRWPTGQPVDVLGPTAVCGDRAYVLAARLNSVHVVDLVRGERIGQIGQQGEGPGEFRFATALGVDCTGDRLYVSDQISGVATFVASSGAYLETNDVPRDFLPTDGRITVVSDAVYVPGLWSPGRFGYSSAPRDAMYRQVTLGWRLALGTGEDGTVTDPIETGCVADGSACAWFGIDRLGPDTWAMAQGGGTSVAILSDTGDLRHRFDVRSPRFLRDGTAVPQGADIETAMAWTRTNSRIHEVYAHDGIVATVHGHQTTEDWRNAQFDFYLNLHTAEGQGLVSDIKLPDLPVGRDGEHLLLIDYGAVGRWGDADQVELLRIPIDPTAHTASR